ncbi:TPA: hypothetical protein NG570_001290 [Vibrio parahaemolyticus]|nr:hypothetical protein [Vibrio parahaemolyticus]HCE3295975.1 hypothetical protein [Vibrio parahaemolyticus]HCG5294330.1 hypothetical protein [Vibrio parahaemolyticus]HCG7223103.1 hypothetical protein [Vibrio parahaemolyticus]HCG7317204.1 hypothetical protein [Vibrio parahaemolyticus]
MKITVFVNDQSEFRMRLQSESKNSYQNLETLTLTDVTEKDIYTFMRNAGFDRTEAQNFTRRLKKRFDTSLFKLAVSKCKKYVFYLSTRYSLAFLDNKIYIAPFSKSDPRGRYTDSKFSETSITFPGKQAHLLGNRKVETVLSISQKPNDFVIRAEQPKRQTVVNGLAINYSIEPILATPEEAKNIIRDEIAAISNTNTEDRTMTLQEAVNSFKRDFPEQYENWRSISHDSVLTEKWFLTKLDAHIENGKLIHPSSMLTSINIIYAEIQKAKKECDEHKAAEEQFLKDMCNQ